MRGRGRVWRPLNGSGKPSNVWMLDYTVDGDRYRESSGLEVKKASKQDAVAELERRIKAAQEGRVVEPAKPKTLRAYVDAHLAAKPNEVDPRTGLAITPVWLKNVKRHLDRAVAFFGAERRLTSIRPDDLVAWVTALRRTISGASARHHLNSLSNVFRKAQRAGLVTDNPVSLLERKEKPAAEKREADWLDVPEATRLLAAAQRYRPKRDDIGMPFAYQLIATLLLTGGRPREVLGLEVDDVSFARKTVTFRPHAHRRLKNAGSERTIKLWPQLEEILRDYFREYEHLYGESKLLFPSFRTKREAPLTDFRKLLKHVVALADPPIRTRLGRGITPKIFRHTYCTARLETLDRGAPVSMARVGKELGHDGDAMVKRVYRHLGEMRYSKTLEYRVAQPKPRKPKAPGVTEYTVRKRRMA